MMLVDPFRSSLSTMAFFASAASLSTSSVTWPAGIQVGDVAVFFDTVSDNPTLAYPAGFTPLANVTGATLYVSAISYKICDGTEAGTLTGMTFVLTMGAKVLLVFRGNKPVAQVTPSGWQLTSAIGTPPALQNIVASAGATPLIVCGWGAGGTVSTVSFTTAAPAFDAAVPTPSVQRGLAGYKIYNSSPADHALQMNNVGSNAAGSGFLQLA